MGNKNYYGMCRKSFWASVGPCNLQEIKMHSLSPLLGPPLFSSPSDASPETKKSVDSPSFCCNDWASREGKTRLIQLMSFPILDEFAGCAGICYQLPIDDSSCVDKMTQTLVNSTYHNYNSTTPRKLQNYSKRSRVTRAIANLCHLLSNLWKGTLL